MNSDPPQAALPTAISIALTLVFAVIALPTLSNSLAHGQTKIQPTKSQSTETANSAKEAWAKLAEKGVKRPEFAFVENDPALPNVLIYGDSISIMYTQRVREILAGKANVYRIFKNGAESGTFIPKMEKMHRMMKDKNLDRPWTFDWDVISFNVGLHDIKYVNGKKLDKENGKQVTSLEDYETNLKAIAAYLKELAPEAKLIFATTTPVPEGAQGRFVGDAQKYNDVAKKVMMESPKITINDLYSFTKPNQTQWAAKPGDVHFNKQGRDAQGDEVARIILNSLPK